MRDPTGEIALGITNDQVALGSHLIHFWQYEEEFERGVETALRIRRNFS